ncbi:hypothetical protein [Vibrio cyclitrophicus]|uniref:hypothetical protein n=1 Tax=Vibrio cyclitrophicus TaxID=47951 RepID=UPI000C822B35|nr:hypothetical protein [Vibrio cyclitrophicus]PMH74239.1 hypothetical protein BCU59_21405 [Vibrio cyclitrophicus]
MAKVRKLNWAKIREQFYEDHQQTGISRNAWARSHGLSPNTARRHIPMTEPKEFENPKSGKRINVSDHAITFQNRDQLCELSDAPSPDRTVDSSEPVTRSNKIKESNKTLKVDTPGGLVSGKSDHIHDLINEQNRSPTSINNSHQEGHKHAHTPKTRTAGAQPGNQNARKHGRYSEFVSANWLIAADETEVEADLMMIRAHLIEAVAYRTELSRTLADHVASYETCKSKETYREVYDQLKCDIYNADSAIVKWKKLQDEHLRGVDERERVRIDTELKTKGVRLTEAKTEHAKTITALNKYELTAKEKEGLGEKNDLGMELDEISDMDDDEINRRFKAREAEQKPK